MRSKQPPLSVLDGAQQPSGGSLHARAGMVPGHWHSPPMQLSPGWQRIPQPPQFIESLSGLTQAPPQQAWPAPQLVLPHWQAPPLQTSLAAQA